MLIYNPSHRVTDDLYHETIQAHIFKEERSYFWNQTGLSIWPRRGDLHNGDERPNDHEGKISVILASGWIPISSTGKVPLAVDQLFLVNSFHILVETSFTQPDAVDRRNLGYKASHPTIEPCTHIKLTLWWILFNSLRGHNSWLSNGAYANQLSEPHHHLYYKQFLEPRTHFRTQVTKISAWQKSWRYVLGFIRYNACASLFSSWQKTGTFWGFQLSGK